MTNPHPFLPRNPLQPAPLTRRYRQPFKSEFQQLECPNPARALGRRRAHRRPYEPRRRRQHHHGLVVVRHEHARRRLHSYGFMDRAFLWLVAFVVSQLACIGVGFLVSRRCWASPAAGLSSAAPEPTTPEPGAGRSVRPPANQYRENNADSRYTVITACYVAPYLASSRRLVPIPHSEP